MRQALYRKYRPKSFEEIIGQQPIKVTLQNALTRDQIAHAYLFAGPRGTGKTSMARVFARALNCEDPRTTAFGKEPCNECSVCREIIEERSLDLVELDAASYRSVEEIEQVLQDIRSGSHRLPWRVFILDEAHMLSRHAFNALLKTLEEPPSRTVIILVTTEPHKLPVTVRSRTQRFDFRTLPVASIIGKLEEISEAEGLQLEEGALKAIAVAAQGSIRDAESNLDKILGLGEKRISVEQVRGLLGLVDENLVIKFLFLLRSRDKQQAIEFADKLIERGVQVQVFLKVLLSALRRVLLLSYHRQSSKLLLRELTQEELNVIIKLAENWKPQEVLRLIKIFRQALETQDNYPLPQMALEIAVVKALS